MGIIKAVGMRIIDDRKLLVDVADNFRELPQYAESDRQCIVEGVSRRNVSGILSLEDVDELPFTAIEVVQAIHDRKKEMQQRLADPEADVNARVLRCGVRLDPAMTGTCDYLFSDDQYARMRRMAVEEVFVDTVKVTRRLHGAGSVVAWSIHWDRLYPELMLYVMPQLNLGTEWPEYSALSLMSSLRGVLDTAFEGRDLGAIGRQKRLLMGGTD